MSEREQKERVIRYYRGSGEEEIAARLMDWADQAQRQRRSKVSFFLDPRGQEIAETVGHLYSGLKVVFDGGYSGAERQKAAFIPEDSFGEPDFRIHALTIRWDGRYERLGHRDILGALLGQGIERELLGDIIMKGDAAQVLGDIPMLQYIQDHLSQVGAANVTVENLELSEIEPREEKVKEIRTTVASLRLDSVAAAGFSTSRSKMTSDIESERLKLNWQEVKSPSRVVKEGDVISCRGKGRVEVAEVGKETRKGRISILLRRYIG